MKALFALTLALSAGASQGQVYRCETSKGWVFSDRPCEAKPGARTLLPTPSPERNTVPAHPKPNARCAALERALREDAARGGQAGAQTETQRRYVAECLENGGRGEPRGRPAAEPAFDPSPSSPVAADTAAKFGSIGPLVDDRPVRSAPPVQALAPPYLGQMNGRCASLNDALRTADTRGLLPATQAQMQRHYDADCSAEEARARQAWLKQRPDGQARLCAHLRDTIRVRGQTPNANETQQARLQAQLDETCSRP